MAPTATKKPTLENTFITEHFWRTKLPATLRKSIVSATGKQAGAGLTARSVYDAIRGSTTVTKKEATATAASFKKFITTGEA